MSKSSRPSAASSNQLPKEKAGELLASYLAAKEAAQKAKEALEKFLQDNSSKIFDKSLTVKIPGVGIIEKTSRLELKCGEAMPIQDIQDLIESNLILTPYLKKEIPASTFPALLKTSELIKDMATNKEIYEEALKYSLTVNEKEVLSFK